MAIGFKDFLGILGKWGGKFIPYLDDAIEIAELVGQLFGKKGQEKEDVYVALVQRSIMTAEELVGIDINDENVEKAIRNYAKAVVALRNAVAASKSLINKEPV